MKILTTLYLAVLWSLTTISAADFNFQVDLRKIEKDVLNVQLNIDIAVLKNAIFYFPKTVPGTYAELDYGRYIKNFQAFDNNGNKLDVKHLDPNSFSIDHSELVKRISYQVMDTWDKKEKKNKVFEPAGTGFEKGKYFAINNGALFLCIKGKEQSSYALEVKHGVHLQGYSSLEKKVIESGTIFEAVNYHQLIDGPILFTSQEATSFEVAGCTIRIASYFENDSASFKVKEEIENSFQAIADFVGTIPVKEYNILLYVANMEKAGEFLTSDKQTTWGMLKFMLRMKGKAFGALEHGTSSLYYLPEFGHDSYSSMVNDVVIHEFMHIYTPLKLHSELIGNFDYLDPKMSKHLWLYEGITEYFSMQIMLQGGLIETKDFISRELKSKIKSASTFPEKEMSFTEMSAGVFHEPYKKEYGQVYERGAVLGLMLDIEIMRLTDGQKTLKNVILDLSNKYGDFKSFSEENFISELVALVHPELHVFFDNYIEGKIPLDISKSLLEIGIEFHKEIRGLAPIDILSWENNEVKMNENMVINNRINVMKVGSKDIVGLKKGDKVSLAEMQTYLLNEQGGKLEEGSPVSIHILRKGEEIELPFTLHYKEQNLSYQISELNHKSVSQEKLFKIWSKGE